jgi:hypothetical protein
MPLEERIARQLCATFRHCTLEKVAEDIDKHGDSFMALWRQMARECIALVSVKDGES